jgi:hypothetical protein
MFYHLILNNTYCLRNLNLKHTLIQSKKYNQQIAVAAKEEMNGTLQK